VDDHNISKSSVETFHIPHSLNNSLLKFLGLCQLACKIGICLAKLLLHCPAYEEREH
jgi:hypothetical protein